MPAHGYRFNDNDLNHIREALQNGVSHAALASSYGVSQPTMSRLINDNDLNNAQKPLTELQKYLAAYKQHEANPDAGIKMNRNPDAY